VILPFSKPVVDPLLEPALGFKIPLKLPFCYGHTYKLDVILREQNVPVRD